MADQTHIEWTDATWNIVTGCSVVSPGCTNCYAMRLAGTRLQHHPSRAGLTIDSKAGPLPNVWLGVSVEDQARADERIPVLLDTPAAVRWISAEPLLGPVDLLRVGEWADKFEDCGGHPDPHWPSDTQDWTWLNALTGFYEAEARAPSGDRRGSIDVGLLPLGGAVNWVVAGGESGPGARPMHPDWARQLRDQCAAAGVPFLFKQWGEWTPGENAGNTIGRAVDTADWFDGRWDFQRLTAASCEGMHIDDEPTLYRAGKKAAGRRLDGVLHDGFPEARA